MWKAQNKGVKNSLKTRGGILFFNSVRKSLSVNEAVRRRALSGRSCAAPVRCRVESKEASKVENKQDTVGNCVGASGVRFGPKDLITSGLRRIRFVRPRVRLQAGSSAFLISICKWRGRWSMNHRCMKITANSSSLTQINLTQRTGTFPDLRHPQVPRQNV